MSYLRASMRGVAFWGVLVLACWAGPAAAEEEGVRTGYVQRVDAEAGIVVIGDQRYRYEGRMVQPPPDVPAESEAHRRRPFRAGMTVRFTVAPGNPPAIHEAWTLD